jgi:hypothetical protein
MTAEGNVKNALKEANMMKIHLKNCFVTMMLIVFGYASSAGGVVGDPKKLEVLESYGKIPLYFIKNRGQLDKRVKFYNKAQGHTTFFTREEVVFRLHGPNTRLPSGTPPIVRLTPLGMKKDVDIAAEGLQPTKINYYIGKDPKKWRTRLPAYGSVVYREAYPGVDLKFYGTNRQLEYDVVVKPGSDPSRVRLCYKGIEKLELTEQGDLNLSLKNGAKLIQKKPVVYQKIAGKRVARQGRIKLMGSVPGVEGHVFGFEVGSYDRRYALIIDPILVSTTYFGGLSDDYSYAIDVDRFGNCYMTGLTFSDDFPVENSFQNSLGGTLDAFVIKLNPSGNALVYATYLGGSGKDVAFDIAVDDFGSCYVTGKTDSDDFPTENPFQKTIGGEWDAFITKLDPSGDALVYSTYLGGSGKDMGSGIAVDDFGSCYVTGNTESDDFPTKNPFQGAIGGEQDAFVAKLNPSGDALVYSTYLGGTSSDKGIGLVVDGLDNCYIAGSTYSMDFPTKNPFQGAIGGVWDAFVTKVNPSGNALVYSTYLGGSGNEDVKAIAIDDSGNCHVTGHTDSDNFPTETPFQKTIGGEWDAFVTKLNGTGDALVYSTYLGGSKDDVGSGIAVNDLGDCFVTGYTDSDNFPVKNPFQGTIGGEWDTFVSNFNPSGNALVYSTYLGGSGMDFGNDIAVYGLIHCYVTGNTDIGGYHDGFLSKIAWWPCYR